MNWEQLKAIVWLRWRLTRNMFSRAGPINVVLSFVMVGVLLLAAMGLGVGGFLAGLLALGKVDAQILLLVWDGVLLAFLFVWATGLMVEIQRSESIDLPKLLHLPVTLQQVFVFNFVASHFTPSLGMFLPLMLGLSVGLTLSAGPALALSFPLALGVVFMVTAWTYCLRGWLAALMVNKRKRRTVIVWITVAFVLVCQLPNVFFNSHYFRQKTHGAKSRAEAAAADPSGKHEGIRLPEQFVQAHLAVPPAWVGYGTMALKQHNPWPALGGLSASCLIGALGLMRAYRMTLRFYQANERTIAPRRYSPSRPRSQGVLLVERTIPWLPDDTAALVLATLRSLWRAPELKMTLIMPVVMIVLMGSLNFSRPHGGLPAYLATFAAAGAGVLACFSFAQVMSNAFGLDRNGFRALVLLPTGRHHILFAKNLAFFPFVAAIALLLLLLGKFLLGIPWTGLLAGGLQVPVAFLSVCLLCNLLAILLPYRFGQGTLQAKKPKPIVILGVFASMLAAPMVMMPVLIPPALQSLFIWRGWAPWLPVNLLATAVILAGVATIYYLLLPLQGKLLQRREQAILKEVTEELE